MKVQRTLAFLLSVSLVGGMACNQVERGKKDVSTAAASMITNDDEAPLLSDGLSTSLQEDTVIRPTASAGAQNPDDTYTETEVVRIDTVSTRIVYDVRRRMIEEVDTVGATKTYEIKRTVLKRTVQLDTLTETKDEEQTVAYEKGDYKKLDEQVESDSIVEVIDYPAKSPSAQPVKAAADKPSQTDVMSPTEASSAQPNNKSGAPASDAPQDTTQRSDSGS